MNSWIDLNALWKIVVFGLIAGAGLPAIFSIGLFSLSRGPSPSRGAPLSRGGPDARAGGGTGESGAIAGGSVAGMIAAAICFLIVLAAIAWGVYEIYVTGHPKK